MADFFSSFLLICLAEMGDKSQLVCMALAVRYRGWPVLLGAICAFSLLNLMAVLFGAAAAYWIPGNWLAIIVASLFLLFGMQALLWKQDEDECLEPPSGRGVFAATFMLIFLAEMGDKTQLAVAGLSASMMPVLIWFSATAALALTSVLGVWAGRRLLQRGSLIWMHRLSGILFILFAVVTLVSHFA